MKFFYIFGVVLLTLPLHAQVKGITSLSYPSNENDEWNFLLDEIGENQVVCLGEESHWVETYLEVKNGIIKELNQEGGFNALIFESGLVNSFVAYAEELDSLERVTESLYNIWQTKAVLDLIHYIEDRKNTADEILMLGCDIKGPVSYQFSRYIRKLLAPIDPDFAKEMAVSDSIFIETRAKWEPEIGKANREKYLSDEDFENFNQSYEELKTWLLKEKSEVQKFSGLNDRGFEFLMRAILNRQYLLELMQLPTYRVKHKFRDEKMAENLNWLINHYAPNKKYIIWGADIHISKDAKWEENGSEWKENKSMIECFTELTDQRVFSIGIKPSRRLNGMDKRKMFSGKTNYTYVDMKAENKFSSVVEYQGEHDGLIFCKKTKWIHKFDLE